jgi:hypothetical protein
MLVLLSAIPAAIGVGIFLSGISTAAGRTVGEVRNKDKKMKAGVRAAVAAATQRRPEKKDLKVVKTAFWKEVIVTEFEQEVLEGIGVKDIDKSSSFLQYIWGQQQERRKILGL